MNDIERARAWWVPCPKGHEFDYMVFTEEVDAIDKAGEFLTESEDPSDGWEIAPLYAGKSVKINDVATLSALESEQDFCCKCGRKDGTHVDNCDTLQPQQESEQEDEPRSASPALNKAVGWVESLSNPEQPQQEIDQADHFREVTKLVPEQPQEDDPSWQCECGWWNDNKFMCDRCEKVHSAPPFKQPQQEDK